MSQRFAAELIDDKGKVAARATATIWTRSTRGGLMDWGGSLDLMEVLPPIEPGAYHIRLEDGREAEIIVNSVRISSKTGRGITCSVTFLGNGELPSVPAPIH